MASDFTDVVAGNAFRDSLVPRADDYAGTGPAAAPLWHGWAIMDAFLAGVERGQTKSREEEPKVLDAPEGGKAKDDEGRSYFERCLGVKQVSLITDIQKHTGSEPDVVRQVVEDAKTQCPRAADVIAVLVWEAELARQRYDRLHRDYKTLTTLYTEIHKSSEFMSGKIIEMHSLLVPAMKRYGELLDEKARGEESKVLAAPEGGDAKDAQPS